MSDQSVGEQRLKARSRRWQRVLFGASAMGFVPGAILGYSMNDDLLDPTAVWPAWIAILLAVTFFVAVSIGSILLYRQVDEHMRETYGKAAVVAGGLFIILYPVWWILWMGGLVPEPIHWVLFLGFYGVYAGSMVYYRYT